jgi:hypothetical protein
MSTEASSRALYYALDAAPRCLFELRRSIASVRAHGGTLPIYVALAGAAGGDDRVFFDAHGVTVLPAERPAGMSQMFMKWSALTHGFREREVLFLDTDTIALDDVSRLFDLHAERDFYARPEIATDPDTTRYPYLVNLWVIPDSQIDHRLFQTLCDRIGVSPRPVWSTGVMLMRNGLAARLAGRWPDVERFHRLFSRKQLPYPCKNAHILEEVIAALVLGTIPTLTWDFLPASSALTFPEYMERGSASPIVLHTGSMFYRAYLCRFEPAAMRGYMSLPIKRAKRWARDVLLPLGSTRLPLPRSTLETWLRRGAMRYRTISY